MGGSWAATKWRAAKPLRRPPAPAGRAAMGAAFTLLISLFWRFPGSAVWNGGGVCARYLTI